MTRLIKYNGQVMEGQIIEKAVTTKGTFIHFKSLNFDGWLKRSECRYIAKLYANRYRTKNRISNITKYGRNK